MLKPLQDICDELKLAGKMQLFGSYSSGFAGKRSDLDITFLLNDATGNPDYNYFKIALEKFAQALEKAGRYSSITKVLHA